MQLVRNKPKRFFSPALVIARRLLALSGEVEAMSLKKSAGPLPKQTLIRLQFDQTATTELLLSPDGKTASSPAQEQMEGGNSNRNLALPVNSVNLAASRLAETFISAIGKLEPRTINRSAPRAERSFR